MALFGLFGSDKPTTQNIQKLVARLREGYAQPEYRRDAMERLIAFNTPEALLGVMQRFSSVAQSPHWDEEEKRWLVDELAHLGAAARAPLQLFLAKENHIAFAAKTLARLDSKDDYVSDLIAALRARAVDDHRTSQGKAEIVAALGETGDARVVLAIEPYLDDHADDVQCVVVDMLEKLLAKDAPNVDETVLAHFRAILADDTRSARVLRHTAGAVARLKLSVDVTKPLAPAVAEDFVVRDGVLAIAHAA
jgi:hypothetical protein